MGKPKTHPPSKVDSLTFPVFGLTWCGTPSSPKNDGCSLIAYCGGGGSSKTGVLNKIVVLVNYDDNQNHDGEATKLPSNVGGGGSAVTAPTFTSREIVISSGEALCFGVYAFKPYNDPLNMARLVACIGDEVLLYGIPLFGKSSQTNNNGEGEGDDEMKKEEAILLGKANVGKGYGANVSTYTALHQDGKLIDCLAVGCENGHVIIFHLHQTTSGQQQSYEFIKVTECQGHTKAICAVNFHPRGMQLLSSGKDGTARVFSTTSGKELAVLKCEVHDPNGPPPAQPSQGTMKTKDPRMMKRPPQILVRGCAYGDLEGKVMYTIASGKRGPAYLTKWRTLVPLNKTPGGGGAPDNEQPLNVNQEYRIQCSPVPISATSLSSDGTMFTMGSVEGSVLLYNLEKQCVVKEFKEVHDLPVTCVATRPVPNVLMLPGELEGGVNFDAVSASADNRLGRWTLQKKSRVKTPSPPKSTRQKSMLEVWLWEILRIPLLLLFLLVIVAVRDTMDICKEQFSLTELTMGSSGISNAGHCLYREVLWAEESRVSFIPE